MTITEKDVKRGSLILLVVVFAFLVYLIVRPVLLTIIGGLILAYMFFPVYRRFLILVKYKNLAAMFVSLLVVALIVVPVWFLLPIVIKQIFEAFRLAQEFRLSELIAKLFPAASQEFLAQIATATNTAISNTTTKILNALVDFFIDFPIFSLHILLMAFVFFFALKDSDKLGNFVSGLFPLSRTQETALKKQFEDITKSLIYGHVVLGFVQGLLAGLGLLVFGVPNAMILTILAIIFGVLPIIGPGLVYVPVTFYLLQTNTPVIALSYFAYNLLIVTPVDSMLRVAILKKRAQMNAVVALIGMIGGVLIFGVLGFIIGPLILAYFITFLEAYKEKRLSSFFSED